MSADEATTEPDEMPRIHLGAFRRSQDGVGGEAAFRGLVTMLDLQAACPAVVRLRAWVLEALEPRWGEVAVDVGSGTGEEVQALATLVGATGRAVGVEPHAAMRAEAQVRAEAAGSRAEFVDAEAAALPFPDASVDVVRCERVFQHLSEPQAAADEIARVLRPGGRVCLVDSDWGTSITHPADPEVLQRYRQAAMAVAATPFAGRHLRTYLARAGLHVDPDIGSTAVILPDALLRRPVMLEASAQLAVDAAAITAEEAATFLSDFAQAARAGEAFASVTMFAVLARRPA